MVRVWVNHSPAGHRIARLRVDVRGETGPALTASRLSRLPLSQILQVAAAHSIAGEHPNLAYYQMLAAPKPAGQRSWDEGHWGRVLQVYDWASQTGWPGGGAAAVSHLWGVAVNPTVYRWLTRARQGAQKETRDE